MANIIDLNEQVGLHDWPFAKMTKMGHEQVVFCHDEETGLKAIIAVHNTVLGPALGGTRMWAYDNEAEALRDVLRLSRGMTFKAAISGLDLGGGKAVIIGDASKDKTDALMYKFGTFVDSLGGKYITAEDVGMTTHDMEVVRGATKHVSGIPQSMGGSGNPSPVTAYGVYMGMKASALHQFGTDKLEGKKVVVQGVGAVGQSLVGHLVREGAEVTVNDINESKLNEVSRKYGVRAVLGDKVYDEPMDIYAPCALGATVNDDTLARLQCKIISGAANNQLADENRHAVMVHEKGILYAPDFLINAGGLINVYREVAKFGEAEAMQRTEKIYDTTLELLKLSEVEGITTSEAAMRIAIRRIEERKAQS
jgi:leucine dehydrogenase